MEFGVISSVAVDSASRVYVYQRADPPVVVFDAEGNYLSSWGKGQLGDAHGIFISRQDDVYLVDRDFHRVMRFDKDGRLLLSIGNGRPSKDAPFNHPADVAVAPNGDIYVADGYGNSLIHRFSTEGKHLQSWGRVGIGPADLSVPHGIWVTDERVYVADRDNNRISVFSCDGKLLETWAGFHRPTDIFRDARGNLYVTELSTCVNIINSAGQRVGRNRASNQGHGIYGSPTGDLYVVSTSSKKIDRFRPSVAKGNPIRTEMPGMGE